MGHHNHINSIRLFNAQAELATARRDIDAWRHTYGLELQARKAAEHERDELRRALEGFAGEEFTAYVLRLQRERDDAVSAAELWAAGPDQEDHPAGDVRKQGR